MCEVITELHGLLNKTIRKQLRDLNCGLKAGRMRLVLNQVRHGSPTVKDLRVFYITDGLEEPTVLSWGMVYQLLLDGEFIFTTDVYTHPDHRRKGYGSMIAKAIRQFYPTERIYAAVEWTTIYDRHGINANLAPLYAEDQIKS